jgi:hypothetical protein
MPITHKEFMIFADDYSTKCDEILDNREKIYSQPGDRLSQFFNLSKKHNCSPTLVAIDLADKHWETLRNLAMRESSDPAEWDPYLMDVINYMRLIAAIVRDDRVKSRDQAAAIVKMMEDYRNET